MCAAGYNSTVRVSWREQIFSATKGSSLLRRTTIQRIRCFGRGYDGGELSDRQYSRDRKGQVELAFMIIVVTAGQTTGETLECRVVYAPRSRRAHICHVHRVRCPWRIETPSQHPTTRATCYLARQESDSKAARPRQYIHTTTTRFMRVYTANSSALPRDVPPRPHTTRMKLLHLSPASPQHQHSPLARNASNASETPPHGRWRLGPASCFPGLTYHHLYNVPIS